MSALRNLLSGPGHEFRESWPADATVEFLRSMHLLDRKNQPGRACRAAGDLLVALRGDGSASRDLTFTAPAEGFVVVHSERPAQVAIRSTDPEPVAVIPIGRQPHRIHLPPGSYKLVAERLEPTLVDPADVHAWWVFGPWAGATT